MKILLKIFTYFILTLVVLWFMYVIGMMITNTFCNCEQEMNYWWRLNNG
jgi:hypothetical protein